MKKIDVSELRAKYLDVVSKNGPVCVGGSLLLEMGFTGIRYSFPTTGILMDALRTINPNLTGPQAFAYANSIMSANMHEYFDQAFRIMEQALTRGVEVEERELVHADS